MKLSNRVTPETVKVYPIDHEKLDTAIDAYCHKDRALPENIKCHTISTMALIREPKLSLISDEYVGHAIPDGKVVFYICKTEHLENGHLRINVMPSYEMTFTLEELEPFLEAETTLAEFTTGRRGYNSRIQRNEAEWINYLNKSKD